MSKLSDEQLKTLNSLTKYSDDIYSLDYFNDYNLDYLLSKNPNTLFKILRITHKIQHTANLGTFNKLPLGCSTFYCKNTNNNAILARNFDYRVSPCLIVKTHPKNGYRSIGICDLNFMLYGYKHIVSKHSTRLLYSPYMCMDGMNEKGLAISVLELNDKPTKQKNNRPKINTSLMIRYILDCCDSVESALKAFSKFDMYSSLGFNYHFHIVDKNQSVIVEYVKNELRVLPSNNKYQCVTNFYLSKDGNNKKTCGKDRYATLDDELTKYNGVLSDKQALTLLTKVKQYYKFTYKIFIKYYVETCYSAIYNLDTLSVNVYKHNNECSFNLK